MSRSRYALLATVLLIAGACGLAWFQWTERRGTAATDVGSAAPSDRQAAEPSARQPTLYCEFTNFADRNPLVGFYFLIEETKTPPGYALLFQREQDGTQADYGGETAPRPQWTLDTSESPPTLRSPEQDLQINLYDYDPAKGAADWFEAGLRSIRYKNLGGKCRRSAA